jgi:hypothetical protein
MRRAVNLLSQLPAFVQELLAVAVVVHDLRLEIAVAQQDLNRPEIHAGLQQMRSEAVPEGVRMNAI